MIVIERSVGRLCNHLIKYDGVLLVIDYGNVSGMGDTFQAVSKHDFKDVLEKPEELAKKIDSAANIMKKIAEGSLILDPFNAPIVYELVKILGLLNDNKLAIAKIINKSVALLFIVLDLIKDFCIKL